MACRNGVCTPARKVGPIAPGTVSPVINNPINPTVGTPMATNAPNTTTQGSFWWGTPEHLKQFQQFTPEQQGALNQILQMGLLGLQSNKFDFGPIAQQARTNFYQSTIPSIAERFTAMGNGQRSSAFQGALGQAGSSLEQALAALESKYNLAQQPNILNLLRTGLTPQFQNIFSPRQPGFLESAGTGALQALGNLIPLSLLGLF